MKSLIFTAGLATLMLPMSAATAAVYSVGGPLAETCYQSALSADDRGIAVDTCTRALTEEALLGPDRAATYVNRGIIEMSSGHARAADADFDQALAINANLSDAYLNKGFLRIREGKGQEALPLLQKGIDSGARRQALAYFARGVAYEQAGDYRSAYNDLVRARRMEPSWSLPGQWLAHYQVSR